MQGWGAFGQKNPAVPVPTAVYAKDAKLPCSFEMVLYPYPAKQPPSLSITKLKVENDKGEELSLAEATGLEIKSEGGMDYLLISHGHPCQNAYGDIKFDGRVACIREDAKGTVKAISMVDGARLVEKGATLIESSGVLDALDVQFLENILKISLSNPHQVEKLSIYAPQITKVELNDLVIPFKRNGDSISVTPNKLSKAAGCKTTNEDSERTIIVSHSEGRKYGEFSDKAGICLQVSEKPDDAGSSIPASVTFWNISLPPEAKVELNLTFQVTPGGKRDSGWKFSDSLLVFRAPPVGGRLAQTFQAKVVPTSLANLMWEGAHGILAEAVCSVDNKVISRLKAHAGMDVKGAKVVDEVKFDALNEEGLKKHKVDAVVHSKANSGFGGPVGNYVEWEFSLPKKGNYIVAVVVLTGGERRKCRLIYDIDGTKVQLPEIAATGASETQKFYPLDLPEGKVKFRWEVTAGWSYIYSAKLIKPDTSRLPENFLLELEKPLPKTSAPLKSDK